MDGVNVEQVNSVEFQHHSKELNVFIIIFLLNFFFNQMNHND
jgi:hypothetical protein